MGKIHSCFVELREMTPLSGAVFGKQTWPEKEEHRKRHMTETQTASTLRPLI